MRALLVGLIALSGLSGARADVNNGRFSSKVWGVELVAPRYWQLSERTSYPNILLWMSRRAPDGKLLLTAERLSKPTNAIGYARATRTVLRSMGFKVRAPQFHAATGAYWADFDDGSSYLRQAYLIRGELGLTLTLSAPSQRLRNQHLRVFDATLRSIRFTDREKVGDGEEDSKEDSGK
ncbi:MAG: hypothetical protein KJO07_22135 [Deltaproteobacteria bacterium]|nr:hypothetical protein [Deltaproteobacteria bacterium]